MIEPTKKKAIHNVAVRVQDDLYRAVKRTFAETDEKFQTLIVKLLDSYVNQSASASPSGGKADTHQKVMEIPLSKIDARRKAKEKKFLATVGITPASKKCWYYTNFGMDTVCYSW